MLLFKILEKIILSVPVKIAATFDFARRFYTKFSRTRNEHLNQIFDPKEPPMSEILAKKFVVRTIKIIQVFKCLGVSTRSPAGDSCSNRPNGFTPFICWVNPSVTACVKTRLAI